MWITAQHGNQASFSLLYEGEGAWEQGADQGPHGAGGSGAKAEPGAWVNGAPG